MLHAQTRSVQEQNRAPSGNARHADPANSAVGAAARSWDRAGDPDEVDGTPSGGNRIALPGVTSPRKAGMDSVGMENVREQSAGEILPANAFRQATTHR